MKRRALLKGFIAVGVPAAAVAVAAKSTQMVQDTKDATLESLRTQFQDLKDRFEESDRSNKKLIKTALALAALSLGIDATSLM